jgi:hypothetical protein
VRNADGGDDQTHAVLWPVNHMLNMNADLSAPGVGPCASFGLFHLEKRF